MFPKRLIKIDDLTRGDHHRLESNDRCYYLGEYFSGRGYAYGATNDLISNLKKPMSRRNLPEWRHKEGAIRKAAEALRENFSAPQLGGEITFVPIPPSKAKSHPEYDDRLLRMLQMMCDGHGSDIRELVIQTQSTDAAHDSFSRPTTEDLVAIYAVDETVAAPPPSRIVLLDDVLTTGAHFKAAKAVVQQRFPDADIVGIFVARRVIPSPGADFEIIVGS